MGKSRGVRKDREIVLRKSTSPKPLPMTHEALKNASAEEVANFLTRLEHYLPDSKKLQKEPQLVDVITGVMARPEPSNAPKILQIRVVKLFEKLIYNKSISPQTIKKLEKVLTTHLSNTQEEMNLRIGIAHFFARYGIGREAVDSLKKATLSSVNELKVYGERLRKKIQTKGQTSVTQEEERQFMSLQIQTDKFIKAYSGMCKRLKIDEKIEINLD